VVMSFVVKQARMYRTKLAAIMTMITITSTKLHVNQAPIAWFFIFLMILHLH
jgi:hypothetical protein